MKEVFDDAAAGLPLLPPGGGDAVPTDGARAPAITRCPSVRWTSQPEPVLQTPGLFLCTHLFCRGLMEGAYPEVDWAAYFDMGDNFGISAPEGTRGDEPAGAGGLSGPAAAAAGGAGPAGPKRMGQRSYGSLGGAPRGTGRSGGRGPLDLLDEMGDAAGKPSGQTAKKPSGVFKGNSGALLLGLGVSPGQIPRPPPFSIR